MKEFLFILICATTYFVHSQETNVNFIIEIDDEIDIALSSVSLIAKPQSSPERIYSIKYTPGNLTLDKNDFEDLKTSNIDKLKVKFTWNDTRNNNLGYRQYTIDFEKSWFDSSYVILSIYNLDNKHNRKTFGKKKGNEEYLYEYTSSEGSELLPRRKRKCKN